MKKIIFLCFFIIFAETFAHQEKLITVDYSYIMDNYYKTKSFNEALSKFRNSLETKYKFNFDDRRKSEEQYKVIETYNNAKAKFTAEITHDIEAAVIFTGQTENYNLIFDKMVVRYGKRKDISKAIVKFLNNVYFHDITIKDEKRIKNDLFVF